MSNNDNHYWKENIRILSILLGIWFVVSFLMSVIFVDQLDVIRIGGFGFWMAQQGSIYIYVILIFVYLKLMDRLDKKYHHEEKDILEEENRID